MGGDAQDHGPARPPRLVHVRAHPDPARARRGDHHRDREADRHGQGLRGAQCGLRRRRRRRHLEEPLPVRSLPRPSTTSRSAASASMTSSARTDSTCSSWATSSSAAPRSTPCSSRRPSCKLALPPPASPAAACAVGTCLPPSGLHHDAFHLSIRAPRDSKVYYPLEGPRLWGHRASRWTPMNVQVSPQRNVLYFELSLS